MNRAIARALTQTPLPPSARPTPPTLLTRPFPSSGALTITNRMSHSAAWLVAEKAHPFEIRPTESYSPEANEILIKNRALAINPIDGTLQTYAIFPLKYPTILGGDVAGEVLSVGSAVTRFKPGDRVLGFAVGLSTGKVENAGFQTYTAVLEDLASLVPEGVGYEEAAVLPLAFSTAACGLFQEAPFLHLDYPTEPAREPNGKIVLVWGGSSSVGCNAIQLARAAGYEVFATASERNFGYLKELGARQVFGYNSSGIENDLIAALSGKEIAGVLDCIGGQSLEVAVNVLQRAQGKGFIATTKGGVEDPPEGIEIGRIFGTTLKDNAVGKAVFAGFLEKALAAGTFMPAPKPLVHGRGLESVQGAVDRSKEGVSAAKVVVVL